MPELPEVETMRRGVLSVVGSTIDCVDFVKSRFKKILISPRSDRFRSRSVGQPIVDIGRTGKRLLIHLANEYTIVIEPRMTGLVLLADPPDEEHLRVGFGLANGPVETLWFWDRRGLGTVRLMSPAERSQHLGSAKLGPDALEITPQELKERLGKSRRAVKVALLDQKAVAGVGNLYASELLHVAGIHPEKRCDRMTNQQWTELRNAMVEVLQEAIKYEGSTLSDGTYRNALNIVGGYQNCHPRLQSSRSAMSSLQNGLHSANRPRPSGRHSSVRSVRKNAKIWIIRCDTSDMAVCDLQSRGQCQTSLESSLVKTKHNQ